MPSLPVARAAAAHARVQPIEAHAQADRSTLRRDEPHSNLAHRFREEPFALEAAQRSREEGLWWNRLLLPHPASLIAEPASGDAAAVLQVGTGDDLRGHVSIDGSAWHATCQHRRRAAWAVCQVDDDGQVVASAASPLAYPVQSVPAAELAAGGPALAAVTSASASFLNTSTSVLRGWPRLAM